MSGHTATPWKVFSKNGVLAILSPNEQEVVHWTGFDAAQFDDTTNKANAALIVTACNSHAELVKALEPFATLADHCPTFKGTLTFGFGKHVVTLADCRAARAALATLTARKVG